MARMTSKTASRAGRSDSVKSSGISPATRQHMIGESAYYRCVQRGFESGHDLDDWLAAEADFEQARLMEQASRRQPAPDTDMLEEFGMQHGGTRSPAQDEALKRIIRGHPRRDIPRIESMEPEDAPSKE
jgi:hypothetical protein